MSDKIFDPAYLDTIPNFTLRARIIVDGLFSGLHKSPHKGMSVEFREHTEYTPGDDIRYIDWKVYARSDKFYIRRSEHESSMLINLLLDTSRSMGYTGEGVAKIGYAATLTAALAYLFLKQGDTVGLAVFNEGIRKYVPPRSSISHMSVLSDILSGIVCDSETRISSTLEEIGPMLKGRGLIIICSDYMDREMDRTLRLIKQIRGRGHEMILFHILDHHELSFPFREFSLFLDMEESDRVLVDPVTIRKKYLKELSEFRERIRTGCLEAKADYFLMDTRIPIDKALGEYLLARNVR